MVRWLVLVVLLVVSPLPASDAASPAESRAVEVVGGQRADEGEYPWVVRLSVGCGGHADRAAGRADRRALRRRAPAGTASPSSRAPPTWTRREAVRVRSIVRSSGRRASTTSHARRRLGADPAGRDRSTCRRWACTPRPGERERHVHRDRLGRRPATALRGKRRKLRDGGVPTSLRARLRHGVPRRADLVGHDLRRRPA